MINKDQIGAQATQALYNRLSEAAKKQQAKRAWYVAHLQENHVLAIELWTASTPEDIKRIEKYENFMAMIKDTVKPIEWTLISSMKKGREAVKTVEIALWGKIDQTGANSAICRPCAVGVVEFLALKDGKFTPIDMSDFLP